VAKNDFLAFATAGTANVEDQLTWEVDPVVSNGFASGLAPSARFNKAWRQAGFPGASVSEWINQQLVTTPIRDNGNVQEYVNSFDAALRKLVGVQTGRTRPPGNLTAFVNGLTGNDANNGLTSTTAFKTIQRGVNFFTATVDIGPNTAYLSIAAGQYNEQILVGGPILGQLGQQSFRWNTTGGQVIINGVGFCIAPQGGSSLTLDGQFLLVCTASALNPNAAVCPIAGSRIAAYGSGLAFGNCPGCYHIYSARGGEFNNSAGQGSYSILGGGLGHWYGGQGGGITVQGYGGFIPITIGGSPVFTGGNFAVALDTGVINCALLSFPGTAVTANRYYADTNGVINTGGGGASYLPGSSPGSVGPNGGRYV
jgi:hypothetical protein